MRRFSQALELCVEPHLPGAHSGQFVGYELQVDCQDPKSSDPYLRGHGGEIAAESGEAPQRPIAGVRESNVVSGAPAPTVQLIDCLYVATTPPTRLAEDRMVTA